LPKVREHPDRGPGERQPSQFLAPDPAVPSSPGLGSSPNGSGPEQVQGDPEVTVLVTEKTDFLQAVRGQPGLLPKLSARGRTGALPRAQLSAGELPQPAEKAGGGPPKNEPASSSAQRDDRGDDEWFGPSRSSSRNHAGVWKLLAGSTVSSGRADFAAGSFRYAHGLPKFHERLVEPARTPARPILHGPSVESPSHDRAPRISTLQGPSSQHAKTVRIERHLGFVERETRHRSRDVRTDTRKLTKLLGAMGEFSGSLRHESTSCLMEVAGARVVARALPGLQYVLLRSAGKRLDRGKFADETFVVRHGLGDPGLLEEHFGDPNSIRRPVMSPRERSSMAGKPLEKRLHARVVAVRRAGTGGTRAGIHRLATRTARL
jgi:hypothetical protein